MRAVERFCLTAPATPEELLAPGAMPKVAYFSPEFGVSAGLPQYSGGLGVLAGDYLRVCADEGQPLVGVGLFYRQGYFHQALGSDGWQKESYRELGPEACGLSLVPGGPIEIPLGAEILYAKVWRSQVGSVPLYLMDSYDCGNSQDLSQVTDRLYGGDSEHRLRQEILLGMGGVRALELAQEQPTLFHSNEGHAGFNVLERIREQVTREGASFAEALELVRSATVFTTHTPVPAGIDRFARGLMAQYFEGWCQAVGVSLDQLMALGHFPGEAPGASFNMAVLGLRSSGEANAVSRLHQAVSRRMFAGLWPELPWEEVPIKAVTNGVHARHWISAEMNHLLERYLGPRWDRHGASDWRRLQALGSQEIWDARQPGRLRLISEARRRLAASEAGRGSTETGWTAAVLDPQALTIGFARRVAEYKRAGLLFSQPERLRRLLLSQGRPVQLLIAGKAHPADDRGKQIIRGLVEAIRDEQLRQRVVFLEDYDIDLARTMYQGADVWLNTPRRPMEACGTSGEKAALSGALNCSILDGWWEEAYNGENGFAIPSHDEMPDLAERDRREADGLFDLLEQEVVPTFFRRDQAGLPTEWLAMVRNSLSGVVPFVLGSRMVADYAQVLYRPALAAAGPDRRGRARSAAAWRRRIAQLWPLVQVEARSLPRAELAGGESPPGDRLVEAVVQLGELEPEDVQVHLFHGPVDPSGVLVAPSSEPMRLEQSQAGDHRYRAPLRPGDSREWGFTVRVMPRAPFGQGPVAETPVRWAARLRAPR